MANTWLLLHIGASWRLSPLSNIKYTSKIRDPPTWSPSFANYKEGNPLKRLENPIC